MFKRFTNGCVRVVNRWLPDPFLFAVILTAVVFIGAMIGTQQGPLELVWAWGGQGGDSSDGFWGLLSFSMQMALVLVLGSAMASAKVLLNQVFQLLYMIFPSDNTCRQTVGKHDEKSVVASET